MTNESAYRYLKRVYLTTKNDSYREALSIALAAISSAGDDHLRDSTKKMTKTPCDLCEYNPPSSKDGKPCLICPATSKT